MRYKTIQFNTIQCSEIQYSLCDVFRSLWGGLCVRLWICACLHCKWLTSGHLMAAFISSSLVPLCTSFHLLLSVCLCLSAAVSVSLSVCLHCKWLTPGQLMAASISSSHVVLYNSFYLLLLSVYLCLSDAVSVSVSLFVCIVSGFPLVS